MLNVLCFSHALLRCWLRPLGMGVLIMFVLLTYHRYFMQSKEMPLADKLANASVDPSQETMDKVAANTLVDMDDFEPAVEVSSLYHVNVHNAGLRKPGKLVDIEDLQDPMGEPSPTSAPSRPFLSRSAPSSPSSPRSSQKNEATLSSNSEEPPEKWLAGRSLWLETYGCQMNKADSEVILSIMQNAGCMEAADEKSADVVLLNTCAIREKAEEKVLQRLRTLKNSRRKPPGSSTKGKGSKMVVGVLGCMAERLKSKLLETDKLVDVVAGPDAYRDLPRLLGSAGMMFKSPSHLRTGLMNVQLSLEETYADVAPVRQPGQVSAFVSITRGCNNLCSFCIVPYVRGRERSRDPESILREVADLVTDGVKEITLLGQNVNSYCFIGGDVGGKSKGGAESFTSYAEGFTTAYKPKRDGFTFAHLLEAAASAHPEVRFRFTSPHPKDFGDDVFKVIARYPNIGRMLHLPAQSGSDHTLLRMRRGYTREAYDALVTRARAFVPGVAISSDFIAGFCGETETDHRATVDLIESTEFGSAWLFAYSRREGTHAARHYQDDVPEDVKQQRLKEIIAAYRLGEGRLRGREAGRIHLVLIEFDEEQSGVSKRPFKGHVWGHTDTNRGMYVAATDLVPPSVHALRAGCDPSEFIAIQPGDYVAALVTNEDGPVMGLPLCVSSIQEFAAVAKGGMPFLEGPAAAELVALSQRMVNRTRQSADKQTTAS